MTVTLDAKHIMIAMHTDIYHIYRHMQISKVWQDMRVPTVAASGYSICGWIYQGTIARQSDYHHSYYHFKSHQRYCCWVLPIYDTWIYMVSINPARSSNCSQSQASGGVPLYKMGKMWSAQCSGIRDPMLPWSKIKRFVHPKEFA